MREKITKLIEEHKHVVIGHDNNEGVDIFESFINEESFPDLATAIEKLVREEVKDRDYWKELAMAADKFISFYDNGPMSSTKDERKAAYQKYEQLKNQQHGTDNV